MESDKIVCPELAPKPSKRKRKNADQRVQQAVEERQVAQDEGHPSRRAEQKLPPLKQSRPKDYFDLQISPEYVDKTIKNALTSVQRTKELVKVAISTQILNHSQQKKYTRILAC